MHRPVQPLPEREGTQGLSHPDRLPSQEVHPAADSCRYELVSEVRSVHSDSVSQNRREAATALASMRGPLVDLGSPNMDRGMPCCYAAPFDGDVLMWEKADILHRQRRSLDSTTYSDFESHVTAPKVHNGASENNISQLTEMMSHLCQSMQAFAHVLKSRNPAASETAVSPPTAAHDVPPKTETERMPSPGHVSNERPQACGTASVSTGQKNIMKSQLFDGKELFLGSL